ncbi:MAG TPA: FAD-dependent oxidoreductase [Pyrinomonadaceae bacterium]|jgi:monomeric sarcosine oxidase|nr:FAD-dependent oxidoreductase [Pyrinomonadaceae bacterium]
MTAIKSYDVAVVGAGVFGAWTAHHLQRSGRSVALLDAYGAANSRASSGAESRVIRMGYGSDEIYTRWAMRSLELWQEFFARTGEDLFRRTGVLWMARDDDPYTVETLATLNRAGVPAERLGRAELEERYPQIDFGPLTWAIFEPQSGALMARRAVRAVVRETLRRGATYLNDSVTTPLLMKERARLDSIETSSGSRIFAQSFVFACGPWLPKVFPEILRDLIHVTRQEVFFFGAPVGDLRFAPPLMPVWIDFHDLVYAIPDLEGRGFKMAIDRHGPPCDADSMNRLASMEGLEEARGYLARRVPALKDAPVLETRVCQYENSSNGDFLIDLHPGFDNVWLVGGGSGHGFKHGPAVGEYAAARVTGESSQPIEPRFALAAKQSVQKRAVF